jgi:excisionase family DNA binding protein
MTTLETAEALGVTTGRVRQAIAAGSLKATKRGRDWDIAAREVERYRRENLGRRGRPAKG